MRPTESVGVGSPLVSRVHVAPRSTLRQIPEPGPDARRYVVRRMRSHVAQYMVSA